MTIRGPPPPAQESPPWNALMRGAGRPGAPAPRCPSEAPAAQALFVPTACEDSKVRPGQVQDKQEVAAQEEDGELDGPLLGALWARAGDSP